MLIEKEAGGDDGEVSALPSSLSSFSSHHAEDSLPKLKRVTWFFLTLL